MARRYITFDYSQLEQLPGMLEQEYQKRIDLFQTALELTAKYAVDLYASSVPTDTGKLKSSIQSTEIKHKTVEDIFTDIGTDLETYYWKFLEYGTIFMDPHPFIAPNRKKITKYLRDTYNELLTKAGLGG